MLLLGGTNLPLPGPPQPGPPGTKPLCSASSRNCPPRPGPSSENSRNLRKPGLPRGLDLGRKPWSFQPFGLKNSEVGNTPSPGNLPDPRISARVSSSPVWQADSCHLSHRGSQTHAVSEKLCIHFFFFHHQGLKMNAILTLTVAFACQSSSICPRNNICPTLPSPNFLDCLAALVTV